MGELSDGNLLDSMVNYLGELIFDVKENDGGYFFFGYDDKEYAQIRYEPNTKNAYYSYDLFRRMTDVFDEVLIEDIGMENVIEIYLEDTLQVEVFDISLFKNYWGE